MAHPEVVLIEAEIPSAVPGWRIFVAELEAESGLGRGNDRPALLSEQMAGFAALEDHLPGFPGLQTPFGLPLEYFPAFEQVLLKAPNLVPAVNIMMRGDVAISMLRQYKPAVLSFADFCREHAYKFPQFSAEAVLHFAADNFTKGKMLSFSKS